MPNHPLPSTPNVQHHSFGWLMQLSFCLAVVLFMTANRASAEDQILVSDMESKPVFKAFPQTGTPQAHAEVVTVTAASGKQSVRFEFEGDGKHAASLVFPFDKSIKDYDVLAFDLFCQSQNGTNIIVTVHPQTTAATIGQTTEYISRVDLKEGRDGWFPIHLTKDRNLYKRSDDKKDNWDNPRAISFSVNKSGQGKVVFFVDNIRFLKSDDDLSRNMLYNGSFEIATNPDAPDGWRRNFSNPPFGTNIWSRDNTQHWHGKSSLRMGHEGTLASAWGRFVRLDPKKDYTFSVYLKADKPGVKAQLEVNGLTKPNTKEVEVDTQWKRYSLTGNAFRARTSVSVTQKSPGVLWLDAAQLEEGKKATEYYFPKLDRQELAAASSSVPMIPSSLNANPPVTQFIHATKAPVIDGKLDDACWQGKPGMTDFRTLETDGPAPSKTQAWIAYDDQAIYLAIRAMEPDMKRLRSVLDGAKSAWSADNVEFFLDTNNDRTSYYHFAINANNSVWSSHAKQLRKHDDWHVDWTSATQMNNDSWTVEVRIPFTSLKPENIGDTIGLNVARTIKTGPGKADNAYSSWSFAHTQFQEPRAYGKAAGFDPGVLAPYHLQLVSLQWNQNKAHARLANLTGKPVTLTAEFQAKNDKTITSKPMTLTLAKDEIKDITTPLVVDQDGTFSMKLLARDASGKQVVDSQPAAFTVSGANQFVFDGSMHNLVIQGQPIEFRATVNLEQDKLAGYRVTWKAGSQQGEFQPNAGVNVWTVPSKDLQNGPVVASATLSKGDKKLVNSESSFTVAAPAPHMVRINRWGRFLEVDGKPFLPFGFFTESLFRGDINDWREVLVDMKKNNCTAALAYMGMTTKTPEKLGAYLDVADEVGIKVFIEISGFFVWDMPKVKHIKDRYQNKEDAMAGLKETLTRYRNHPALLGWCAFDEPSNRPDLFTGKVIAEAAQAVKALDPYHPFFCTHLNQLGDAKIFGKSVDLGLMPFLSTGGRYDAMFRELRQAGLPVITNSPAYGAAGNAKHEPSIASQRVNTYKSILMGSCGIQYYLFRPASQMLWESMGDMGVELQQLKPALLNVNPNLPLQVTTESSDIMAVLRQDGDDYYLLMLNMDSSPQKVMVDFLSLKTVQSIQPLFNSPSATQSGQQARLTVTLPASATGIYKIKGVPSQPQSN